MRCVLGVDLGTSACKAGLFDLQGNPMGIARGSYAIHRPHQGWAEQSPDDWWTATCQAVREVLDASDVKPDDILGISFSGQTPGHALVNAQAETLGRAIIWQDRRASAEAAWMAENFTPEELQAYTGLAFTPDSAMPPSRLLWLRDHDPHWDQARWVLQPKDYLAFRLTGNATTDSNSAYALAHAATLSYDADYFARLGISPERLPPVCDPTSRVGEVTSRAAEETGLAPGTPVISGTIDAWCGIAGAGGAAGQAVDITGTSEVVALIISKSASGPGLGAMTLAGDLGVLISPMQLGADAMAWLRQTFYPQQGEEDFATMETEAAAVSPGSDGLIFLPYLLGERAPIWDDQARGAFVGCRREHRRGHFARAVYEGGAFAIRHVLILAEEEAGLDATELRIGGGGSKSDLWNQIKADVTRKRVACLEVIDTSVLGAAIWAAAGLGIYADVEAASAAMVNVRKWIEPDAAAVERYDTLFSVYLDLYPALKEVSHRISRWASDAGASSGDATSGDET